MRVEIKRRPYDLYAVMGASVLLMLVLLFTPRITLLRVVLGLPFILFFPGYVLISLLYPEKQKIIGGGSESEAGESPGSDLDSENRELTKYERRQARRRRKEERKREDSEVHNNDDEAVVTKGIDGLERTALSLGLSVAITPLIGLVLSFTYDWDPQNLGLRLIPIFASQFVFIIAIGGAAVWRRLKTPLDRRFGISVDISMPEDYSVMDKALTIGIVIMIILSVSLLIYIVVFPREGESFTEFYVLGTAGKADDYPRYVPVGSVQTIILGISNNEHRTVNYTLVGMIFDGRENETLQTFDNIDLSGGRNPSMEVSLEDGGVLEMKVNFTIDVVGHHKLRFYLYLDGNEYRSVHIWFKVFPEGSLGSLGSSDDISYIAGLDGDPNTLLDPFDEEFLGLSVNYHRSSKSDVDVTVRMNISEAGSYQEPELILFNGRTESPILLVGNLTISTGILFQMHVNATEINQPILIRVPAGDWILTVRVISPSGVSVHSASISREGR